jgi:ribonuclease HI
MEHLSPPPRKETISMTIKKKPKYYVVWKGRKTGIFTTWEECSKQVRGYYNAKYKSFESKAEADKAFRSSYEIYLGKYHSRPNQERLPSIEKPSQKRLFAADKPIRDSYAVDAACSGNPGRLEFRCVYIHPRTGKTQKEIFRQGPFAYGTNNIGEFLAIVQALMVFKKKNITQPIYSDSKNAIAWVKRKKCRTKLIKNERNTDLFKLIEKAERWLQENQYSNPVLKWKTREWGEIPADFGRKKAYSELN